MLIAYPASGATIVQEWSALGGREARWYLAPTLKDRVFVGQDVSDALAVAAASLGLPQAELRYVGDGIAEGVIADLAPVRDLRVMARGEGASRICRLSARHQVRLLTEELREAKPHHRVLVHHEDARLLH